MLERPFLLRHVYASASVLVFVAACLPLWLPLDGAATESLWAGTMSNGDGGTLSAGLVVTLILVTMIGSGAARGVGVPLTTAVLAGLGLLVLSSPPTDQGREQDLAVGGSMLYAVCLVLLAAAVVDLVQAVRSAPRTGADDPPVVRRD